MKQSFNKIPHLVLIGSLIIITAALLSDYFFELTASVLLLNILFLYFWRRGHPPVILGAFLYMWISVTVGYFYAVFLDGKITDLLWHPFYSADNINRAFWYSLTGVFSLATGVKLALGKTINKSLDTVEIYKLNILKLLVVFVIYSPFIEMLFQQVRFVVPGLSQFVHMLRPYKWSFFFLAAIAVFQTNRMVGWFWLTFFVSLLLSFTNYFASFKPFFFILPIAFLSIRTLSYKQVFYLGLVAVVIFYLGVYWSYIKGDYRMFLSGGRKAQIVVVSKKEALKQFFSYAKEFDKDRFKLGEEALFKRLFYLEFFSATIRMIPEYKPFMKGENLMRAIRHVTMPRFLFPNKPPLDDSRHVIELTGIYVASSKQGTSISVGYMSELYADFGPFWMNFPLLLLGLLWGFIYRFILNSVSSNVWGFAMTIPMFFIMYLYERDLVKLIGDTLWFFITFLIIRFTVLKPVIRFFYIKNSGEQL